MQQVLVLNASYEPLNVCSVRRAHVLVHKQKAELVEVLDRPLRSAETTYAWPHVVRLRTYVRVPAQRSGASRGARSSPATAGSASTAERPASA